MGLLGKIARPFNIVPDLLFRDISDGSVGPDRPQNRNTRGDFRNINIIVILQNNIALDPAGCRDFFYIEDNPVHLFGIIVDQFHSFDIAKRIFFQRLGIGYNVRQVLSL